MLKLCLSQRFLQKLGKQIKAIKTLAKEKYGRPEGSIKFLQLITLWLLILTNWQKKFKNCNCMGI